MDIKQYIASGVLELYLLGRLSPEEAREVEANALQYPEIRAEMDEIELALEAYAQANSSPLPEGMLDSLMDKIGNPPSATPPPSPPVGSAGGFGLGRIGPWLLTAILAIGAFYLFNRGQDQMNQYRQLQQQFIELEEDCGEQQTRLAAARDQIVALSDPATRQVLLDGTDNAPDSRAFVYYNPEDRKTLFAAANLPEPPAGKQYQLWAIDADGPKDMGVLALDLTAGAFLEVPHFDDVAAFAITLEDEGGKPTPDLSQLQVIGNVG
ncbi:anti-sigma factor [Lewinella sp. W8]|uniref:anti-sigma factor n=1 Tax=Lewinella sp. W8 TaxID=2528208 RepID=UPI0010687D8B|nr:anti-sigma factor [Lewinella sp. W8]MTB52162.1 hypothetical protein [Lewinella sp. W8]